MKAFVIGLVVIVVLGVGGYMIFRTPSKTGTTNTNTSSQSSKTATKEATANTITFDGSQFTPASLTVASGTSLTVKNTSSTDVQMQSDPHPAHTDDTDLNVGLVSPGQTKTFTVTKKGSFGYHNHLDSSIQGKITIQ